MESYMVFHFLLFFGMLGFSGIIGSTIYPHISNNVILGDNYCFQYTTNSKFSKDKVFTENEDYVWGLDGYVLNRINLQNSYANKDWSSFILLEFLKRGDKFVKELSGEFFGFIFNKKENKIQLFNNATGSKSFHYYQKDRIFTFSAGPNLVKRQLDLLHIPTSFDEVSIAQFLSYGYYINFGNLFKEIKKMYPAEIVEIRDDSVKTSTYRSFSNLDKFNADEPSLLKEFNHKMTEAVRINFEKDRSENYSHYVTLSGGLDSRVTSMIGHQLGYTDQFNMCCSQENYDDHLTSQKIAKDLHHGYFFYPLDNPKHLMNPKDQVDHNDGLVNYSGAAHIQHALKSSLDKQHGLVQSGQLGDAILGGFLTENHRIAPSFKTGLLTDLFVSEFNHEFQNLTEGYEDEESFKLYTRGFQLNHNCFWLNEESSYYSSPFLNEDFLEFSMRIPDKYKFREFFYIKWIQQFQKSLTGYPWEYIHMKPDAMWKVKHARWINYVRYAHKKYSKAVRLKNQMTPEDYWLNTIPELNISMQNSFNKNFASLPLDFPFQTKIKDYFKQGDFTQKTVVLTLLQAVANSTS